MNEIAVAQKTPPELHVALLPSQGNSNETPGKAGPGRGATAPAPDGLPCLNSIICNENPPPATLKTPAKPSATSAFSLTPGQARSAFALQFNVNALADKFGIEHLGFLTLTFAEHITAMKEPKSAFTPSLRACLPSVTGNGSLFPNG